MIELTGLNGDKILVAAKNIFRIRATTPSEGSPATKVEYGGGYVFTLEAIDHLLARLNGEIRIVTLTTRSTAAVYLNVGAITRVREALPINGPGTEIMVGNQYQHVTETVAEVMALIA
jgi:hypothetical protein